MTINDLFNRPIEINKPIRLIELFGGIGSQAMALRNIGAKFEHYRLVEFDKYPVASYNAIHGTEFVPMDIREVHAKDLGIQDTKRFTYLLTYSFPCQDLSLAGKQRGMTKGTGTRSLECWRLMGFTDEDFYKAEAVNSNTQLYKQAGNSIVTNCLEAIMSQMNIEGVKPWNEKIKENV